MKKNIWLVLFLLLISSVLAQETLYQQDFLELELNIDGSFELTPTKSNAKVKEVTADLFLYPEENHRQKILDLQSNGKVQEETVFFEWKDEKIEKKEYNLKAIVKTDNLQIEVKDKIPYPIPQKEIVNLQQYLKSTEIIDSDNPEIIAKASELVEGEDDLFKAVFKLASWVEENINYDLNTVTAEASQKGSWVLENRQGVCDEMTTLFVAMARSVGIPARFVSGISYSNDLSVIEAVGSNWAGHGWAEIYFPSLGWVSFDVTFNQYGYIDVTHIKLRDGFDPTEAAVKYYWLSDGVDLNKGDLNLDVNIRKKGDFVSEKITLDQQILSEQIGFGSYNLIKGTVKNNADYYAATALNLAVPEEIEVIGRNRRNILLEPKEIRETFWVVKVPSNLNDNYIYTFPVLIYSEKNASFRGSFKVQQGETYYSKKDIDKLTIKDEEKSYSRDVSFQCDFLNQMELGSEQVIECTIRNRGNSNLENLNFCLGNSCRQVNLPINQKTTSQLTVKAEKEGVNRVIVSAENDLVEKKIPLEYSVLDLPLLSLILDYPQSVQYGDNLMILLRLKKESFSQPEKVAVTLEGPGFENKWNLEKLENQQDLILELESTKLGNKNKFLIRTEWKDNKNKTYHDQKEIIIEVNSNNTEEKIRILVNRIINFFKV